MILQITSDFFGSKVYLELFDHLNQLNCNQLIAAPRKKENYNRERELFFKGKSKIIHKKILFPYHRYFFYLKIKQVKKFIHANVNLNEVSLIHAHFLFSDGSVAYQLSKEFGIPYIITVRNTDLNLFYKYRPLLKAFIGRVIKNAKSLIYLTDYSKAKHKRAHQSLSKHIEDRGRIIPNGLSPFWINHRSIKPKQIQNNHLRVLYVGEINPNKNILLTIKSIAILRKRGLKISFTIVGKSKQKRLNKSFNQDWINYVGEIKDKKKLLEIYKNSHVFSMPSKSESFGLVYLEALSQRLPIIHFKEEGLGSYFQDKPFCQSVSDQKSMTNALLSIKNNYVKIQDSIPSNLLHFFEWNGIAERVNKLYNE